MFISLIIAFHFIYVVLLFSLTVKIYKFTHYHFEKKGLKLLRYLNKLNKQSK